MKTLFKYVSKEFILPFFIGLVGFIIFASVELLYQLSDIIVRNHVSFWSLLVLIYYNLPQFVVMGIPVGVLLAIFWEISNFSSRRELMAFQVHGINLKKFVIPFLVIGVVLSFGAYFIQDFVVPNYNQKATDYITNAVWHTSLPSVRTNTLFKAGDSYFYVERYDPNTEKFDGVLIYKITGNDFTVTYAKNAYLQKGNWFLKNGRIYTLKDGVMTFDMSFKTMKLKITQDIVKFIRSQKTASSMSSRELRERIKLFKKLGLDPRVYVVELNSRFANSIAPLIIAFLGVPFSLFFGMKSKSWGVIVTFVLVVLYQGSGAWLSAMGKSGMYPAAMSAWTPDVLFALLGTVFFLLLDSKFMFKIKEMLVKIMPVFVVIFIVGFSFKGFGTQFTVSASSLRIVSSTEVVYSGNVKVEGDDYTIESSTLKVLFDAYGRAKWAIFEGNVVFIEGEKRITASKLKVELQGYEALLSDVRGVEKVKNAKGVKENVYFYGKRSVYDTKSGTSVITPGYITTCDFSPPHYKIEASKIYFVPGDHMVAYNVVMYLFGLPILYLPQYYYSLAGGKQPMEVTVNHSASNGWYTAVKFNFSPLENLNASVFFSSYQKGASSQNFNLSAKMGDMPLSLSYSKSEDNGEVSSENLNLSTSGEFLGYSTAFSYSEDVLSKSRNSALSLSGPVSKGKLVMKLLQNVANGVQNYELPYSVKGFKLRMGNFESGLAVNGKGNFSLPSKQFSFSTSAEGNFSMPFSFLTLKSIGGEYKGGLSVSSNSPFSYSTFVDASYAFKSFGFDFLGANLNFSYSAKTGFEKNSANVELSSRFAGILKSSFSDDILGLKISAVHTLIGVGGKNVSIFDTHSFENKVDFSLTYGFPVIPLNANAKFSYDFNNFSNPWSNIALTTSSKFGILGVSNVLKTTTVLYPTLKPINTKYTLDSKWKGISYSVNTLYDYSSNDFSDISNEFTASLGTFLFLSNFKFSSNFVLSSKNLSLRDFDFKASANVPKVGLGLSSEGTFKEGKFQSLNLNFSKSLRCLGLKGSVSISPNFKISDMSVTLYITAFPEKYVSVDPIKGSFGFSFF